MGTPCITCTAKKPFNKGETIFFDKYQAPQFDETIPHKITNSKPSTWEGYFYQLDNLPQWYHHGCFQGYHKRMYGF